MDLVFVVTAYKRVVFFLTSQLVCSAPDLAEPFNLVKFSLRLQNDLSLITLSKCHLDNHSVTNNVAWCLFLPGAVSSVTGPS